MGFVANLTSLLGGRPFVKWFALCYRTVVCPVCLSCLSVTLVYCGQTVGWIRMPLGIVVGLGSGHIVLDGDPAPPRRGHSNPLTFRPISILWPNGWMHQDATWYGGRPWSRPHCVGFGPSSPPSKGHSSPPPPVFQPKSIVAKWLEDGSGYHLVLR